MPRSVRNFWLSVDCGGKVHSMGPKTKDGGFTVRIQVRSQGVIGPSVYVLRGEVREPDCPQPKLALTLHQEVDGHQICGDWVDAIVGSR